MRAWSIIWFLMVVACAAVGQGVEAGGFAGVGWTELALWNPRANFAVGAETCVRCGHLVAAYGEYTHMWRSEGALNRDTVDLGSMGVRLQGGSQRRFRPFGDAGFAVTRTYTARNIYSLAETKAGFAVGGGMTVRLGRRYYLRPFARLYIAGGDGFLSSGLGFGGRF